MMLLMMVQRLRRSIPSSLSRCRSAGGTWTTTTSATGMPSLDTEPPASVRRPYLAAAAAAATADDEHRCVSTTTAANDACGGSGRVRQHLLTSDYESGDCPSSGEHAEHRLSFEGRCRQRDELTEDACSGDADVSHSPSPPPAAVPAALLPSTSQRHQVSVCVCVCVSRKRNTSWRCFD